MMNVFFDNFNKTEKINLFLGDYFNEVAGFPTKEDIAKILLSKVSNDTLKNLKDLNSFSGIVQAYLDEVIETKVNLIQQLRDNFEIELPCNLNCYDKIFDINCVESIFTANFNTVVEKNFYRKINKITPFSHSFYSENLINYYKIFGDIDSMATVCVSSQDIKKLKTLDLYLPFFEQIRKEIETKKTVLLGVKLDDLDVLNTMDFIISSVEAKSPIYIVTDTTIINAKTAEFLNKHNIKLVFSKVEEFLETLKKFTDEVSFQEKKIVW